MTLLLHSKDIEGTCKVDEDTVEKLSEVFALALSAVTSIMVTSL